jgi:hypothetical protein
MQCPDIALEDIKRLRGIIDKDNRRCPAAQGLKAQASTSGEQVENADPRKVYPVLKDVEDGLLGPAGGWADRPIADGNQRPSFIRPGDDSH